VKGVAGKDLLRSSMRNDAPGGGMFGTFLKIGNQ
jgi:hypothetical protein